MIGDASRISKSMPKPLYTTRFGTARLGDSLQLMKGLPDSSVNLVLTSPPFPLQREKAYGNPSSEEGFIQWFLPFSEQVKRVLKEDGSFVLDLGGVYVKGRPIRSLYNFKLLVEMCEGPQQWRLAEDFYWYNTSKLPSPIEWVNKRKIRVKDAINTIWWLSKTDHPKADASAVLVPYSERMKRLLKLREKFYSPVTRPSGHAISDRFMTMVEGRGAIPPNVLAIPNTDSNSSYVHGCRVLKIDTNPARFSLEVPEFFIKFLTKQGDLVLDIFAGSNTTGEAAETLGRKWLAFELERKYLAASAFRFVQVREEAPLRELYSRLMNAEETVELLPLSRV
jgi:DNA modification methylase